MIDRTVTVVIDQDLCNGCASCIKVCSNNTITLFEGKACITGDESLNCDHCAAACTTGALTVEKIDRSLGEFKTFEAEKKWIEHGKYNTTSLVNLMQSRRSCRNFKEKPVEPELLEDLVKIGITAPSGSNCQMWTFSILPNRQKVEAFGNRIKQFFAGLNKMAEKSWLRMVLKVIGKPELSWYYQNYYRSIKEGLEEWETSGKDLLFHKAPAVIIVGAKDAASCPSEDALLATQNILLAAHAMGLGTCLIGFAVSALQKDKKTFEFIKMAEDEKAYAVIAIGYSAEKYQTVTGRKPIHLRYVD